MNAVSETIPIDPATRWIGLDDLAKKCYHHAHGSATNAKANILMTNQHPIPIIDWGSKPSVNELYSVERQAQTPSKVLAQEAALKGHRGLCAGREFELEQMASYFQTQHAALNAGELEERDCLAMLITNAPGAGKSTLLEEFTMRCAGEGMTCIPLDAESLHRETWLIDALTEYANVDYTEAEVRLDNLARRIAKATIEHEYAPTATAVLIGAATAITAGVAAPGLAPAAIAAGAAASGGIAQLIVGVAQKIRAQRQSLAGEIEQKKPATAKEALELLDEKYEGRFLFIIDECHNLATDAENHINVKKNIRTVTDPSRRRTGQRLGGGAVLAGLGDAVDALDGFHLTRAKVIWLSELDEEPARATIEHQLSKAAIDIDRLRRVAPEWSQRLTQDFTYWPQHSAAAGELARRVLEMTEPGAVLHAIEADDAERLEWVRTATAKQIIQLYTLRWNVATDKGFERVARAIVALANRTVNRIPKDSIPEVIRQAHASQLTGKTLADIEQHEQVVITRMIRSGILCGITETLDLGREITHWEMGIPSLRRFVSENATDDVAMMAYEAADAALAETAPRYLEDT